MSTLIVITGMPGSGKGEAANVAKKLGFKVFAFGDVIREEVRKHGKVTKATVEKFSEYSYKKYRDRNLVRLMKRKIDSQAKIKNHPIIIEGARCPEQISELKKYYEVKTLAITCPKKLRYKRQLARHRFDIGSIKDVINRDKRELSYGIDKIINSADYSISNNRDLKAFRSRVKEFLLKVK